MKENVALLAFNRGLMSRLALARTDLKRTALSAEIMTNWMPRTLGSMMLRPGLQYIDPTRNNEQAVNIPFIFSASDTAIIELTNLVMRVRVNETVISRVSVASAVSNGTFNSNLTGWTDNDESGATSDWKTGGFMSLIGNGTNAAIRSQQVTVASGDIAKEHALTIVIERGPVVLRVGSSSGADDYIRETTLGTGAHSLAFTPVGNFHIQLSNRRQAESLVDSVQVAAAGEMQVPTPWGTSALSLIRWDQSADVIYLACQGYQQYKIERRATRSWSVVKYEPEDGPFRNDNTGPTTLTASGLTGDITLTASASLFRSSHVGALFRLTNTGQQVTANFTGANQFSNSIRVTGVGDSRVFTHVLTGTWSATVTLQRSIGSEGNWEDVTTFTTNGTRTYNDGLDNQIVFYRLGIKTGNYTSGTATLSLTYSLGTSTGVVRITGYTSATSVTAAVLDALGGTTATADWAEGLWSNFLGWPSAVALDEGRLWWLGKGKWVGSVSDAYESFDDTVEGDSGPIIRSIGSGPVDDFNWVLPLSRLIAGAQLSEKSARSSSLDEPLTPNNFNLKDASTRGSSAVAAAKIDRDGIYVRNTRAFRLTNSGDTYSDYQSLSLNGIAPETGKSGFRRIAVQRYPDTRVHFVRGDGKVAVLVFDAAEDVECWLMVETDGTVEDAFVLPGEADGDEDKVYYVVKRTINGVTKRYLERWALESECVGGTLTKLADSHIVYSGVSATTITGLTHLEAKQVVVWGNGKDLGTFTVSGGQISGLSEAVTSAVIGLYYEAPYKAMKLAYGAGLGTALTQKKRVNYLGLILADTHYQGLRYGPSFDTMDDLPLVEDGEVTPDHTVWESYDEEAFEFPGEWDTDSRICLLAAAPRPCTVLAAVVSVDTDEKA